VYQVHQSGSYYAVLSNNQGCSVTTIKKNIIIDEPRTGITYPVKYTLVNEPLGLQARQFGTRFLWNPGVNLNDAASASPLFTGASDQLYAVNITTATGCLTTDTQLVKIISRVDIYVPNGFTPNKDGKNDVLRPLLRGIKELHYFRVFNRFGQLLFETNQESAGWDGTIKGYPQQAQTVVWVVEGLGVDNQVHKKTGSSVLVR
jgi:gliding motility-associated-like protein